jgi:hypothetical protein
MASGTIPIASNFTGVVIGVAMASDPDRFRRQAQYCRDEAAIRPHSHQTREVWLKLADEYDKLALAAEEMLPPPHGETHVQAMQQQHQHRREDD